MDPLSDILSLVQPRTYATGGLRAGGTWGVRFPKHGMVKCYSVVQGQCWLAVDGVSEPVPLRAGNCLLLPRGWPFILSSEASAPLDTWESLSKQERYNGITEVSPGEDFLILGSHFQLEGDARFLLDSLPPIVLLESETQRESLRWAVERLLREMRDPQPGSTVIAQQIAYTMLVEALRLHAWDGSEQGPGWLAALADARLRKALASMHGEIARTWTVEELAHAAGMSRTAFAQLFRRVVGKSPMEYLSSWRMTVAAKKLWDREETVSSVAAAVGYDSESAFSAAFKRHWGSSPREHRRSKRSTADAG